MSPPTGRLGHYITVNASGEAFKAYIQPSLPPNPPIEIYTLLPKLEQASQAIGRLDGLAAVLPDINLFLYHYIRKEALLSSQIEGTQSSFSDLILHEIAEAPGVPVEDVEEVSAYVAAMNHGLTRLREGFPLSLRLIREIHGILLATDRGRHKQPGEFRRSQNWIGGTRPGNAFFVPPPPEALTDCLGNLERFLHEEHSNLPVLLKAGLFHVQFETIHPFLDGNGRLGRLLITLILCEAGILKQPTLYLSLHLKAHRSTYYRLLNEVREQGAWEAWLEVFLDGVITTANGAVETTTRLLKQLESDKALIETLGRAAENAARAHTWLQTHPVTSVQALAKGLNVTPATAGKVVQHLVNLRLLKEVTGKQRDRLFAYDAYLAILSENTEPLS